MKRLMTISNSAATISSASQVKPSVREKKAVTIATAAAPATTIAAADEISRRLGWISRD